MTTLHILNWDALAPFVNIFQLMPQKHLCVHLYFQDWTIVTQLCLVHHHICSRNFKTQLHGSSLEYLDQSTPHHCSVPYNGYQFNTESNTKCVLCAIFQWQTPVQHTYPALSMCIHQLDHYALLLIIVYALFPRWKQIHMDNVCLHTRVRRRGTNWSF